MEKSSSPPYTVMIIDDLESEIDILMACLSEQYRVKVALDGETALEDIAKEAPDLILLDILMPGLDGYEVCRRIKANRSTREIPILFVTSLTEAVDETRGFELGAVDYITKPFNFKVIQARIKTHLELAEARNSLKHQNAILQENIRLREQVEHITRHDLKNPLQTVMGMADLMLLSLDMAPPQQDEMASMLENQLKACDTMLNMINGSMTLYRMENHCYQLECRPTDILQVLDRVLLGLKEMAEARGIQVKVTINAAPRQRGDQFLINCEEFLFYSMMSNLVKNAMEASPPDSVVAVSMAGVSGPTITIENQGAVPLKIRDNFFDKFVTSGKEKGTGIGTYSAKLIADIHGAKLEMATSDERDMTLITIKWRQCTPA